jgi:hypothetical protein
MSTLVDVQRNKRFLTYDEEQCLIHIVGGYSTSMRLAIGKAISNHYYSLDRNRLYWKQFKLNRDGLFFEELATRSRELATIRKDILQQVKAL